MPAPQRSTGAAPWLRWLKLVAALLGGAVLLAAFIGYQQPELLLDFVNLRYCG